MDSQHDEVANKLRLDGAIELSELSEGGDGVRPSEDSVVL